MRAKFLASSALAGLLVAAPLAQAQMAVIDVANLQQNVQQTQQQIIELNRLRYVKDPDTGKRISRPNPEDKWIIQDVPELRIVDADLWQRVKDRQSALEIESKTKPSGKPLIDRRRPRYLFSGLIKCGCCGGGFSMISQSLLGCSTARNKNTCNNRLTIKREVVEQRILAALRERLMEPALFAEFCQEFTKEMNRLRMDATASLAGKRAELAKIERQLQKLLDTLLDDGDSRTIVKNMQVLEARQETLEAELSQADSPPPLLHCAIRTKADTRFDRRRPLDSR